MAEALARERAAGLEEIRPLALERGQLGGVAADRGELALEGAGRDDGRERPAACNTCASESAASSKCVETMIWARGITAAILGARVGSRVVSNCSPELHG